MRIKSERMNFTTLELIYMGIILFLSTITLWLINDIENSEVKE